MLYIYHPKNSRNDWSVANVCHFHIATSVSAFFLLPMFQGRLERQSVRVKSVFGMK